MSDRMPEDMPDRMPEDMSDRMSQDMPDRMPEDLPVRICINVMVGITRSKVIGLPLFFPDSHYTFAIVDVTDPGFRRCAIPSGDARMGDGRAY